MLGQLAEVAVVAGLGVACLLVGGPGPALSEEDKVTVQRARRIEKFLSHPMFVAQQFTGQPGVFVPLKETVASFKAICEGKYDHLPEQAFFMVGGIEDVEKKAKEMERQ